MGRSVSQTPGVEIQLGLLGRLRNMRTGPVTFGLLIVSMACTGSGGNNAQRTPQATVAVASPTVVATWASFKMGAENPHKTLADGLQITDVETAGGPSAQKNDLLTVNFIIWLGDGRQVDSTDAEGQAFKFTLGTGQVIAGWDEGLIGLGVGGIRRLVIPPALAYGSNGAANSSGVYVIPPNATLVCVVRLLALTRQPT